MKQLKNVVYYNIGHKPTLSDVESVSEDVPPEYFLAQNDIVFIDSSGNAPVAHIASLVDSSITLTEVEEGLEEVDDEDNLELLDDVDDIDE